MTGASVTFEFDTLTRLALVTAAALGALGALAGLLPAGHRLPMLLAAAASVAIAVAGVGVIFGPAVDMRAGDVLGFRVVDVRFDALSGVFLVAVGFVGAAASIYAIGYHEAGRSRLDTLAYMAFIASLVLVFGSASAFSFLFAWELMAISSAMLVIGPRPDRSVTQAGYVYLAMTHLATAAIAVAFAIWAAAAGSIDFAAFPGAAAALDGTTRDVVFLLLLVGFGTKAGMMPLHVWLPRAHPVAPSHVSALMSGVMIKAGIYGLIRFAIEFLGTGPAWWALVVLAIGAASAILGVLYALAEHDLKRLLAFHSIENIGIILLGVGVGMLGMTLGSDALVVLGLAAALFHTINHALFKGLLFLGAGAVQSATGTRDLNRLGGLVRLMPVTALAFGVGAAAISGLPPLNGFASEWLTFQGLLAAGGATGLDPLARFAAYGAVSPGPHRGARPRLLRQGHRDDVPGDAANAGCGRGARGRPVDALGDGGARARLRRRRRPGHAGRRRARRCRPDRPGRRSRRADRRCDRAAADHRRLRGRARRVRPRGDVAGARRDLEIPGDDRAPGPDVGLRHRPGARLRVHGDQFLQAASAVLRACPAPGPGARRGAARRDPVPEAGDVPQRGGPPDRDPRLRPDPSRQPGLLGRDAPAAARNAPAVPRLHGHRGRRPAAGGTGMTTDDVATVGIAVAQVILVLACAPLLQGILRKLKARLQYRRGPSVWQPYRDLRKWWGKTPVESDTASVVTAAAPVIVLAAMVTALLLLPIISVRPPLGQAGDLLVVIGLLALARFVMALAALDAGSAFGGMGASREVAIASLVEPGILLALAVAVAGAGTTDLSTIAAQGVAEGLSLLTPSLLLAALAFGIVAIAETGHEPVDNPDTHLELTMIHEGMLLEASGRRLAMLAYASQLKLVVVVGLFVAVFLPFGMASSAALPAVVLGAGVAFAKLLAAACGLGLLDAGMAKMRILALPGLLGVSSLLALTALAAGLWLPA
jgi:formate hydrogenlyase subunit 3/multisubunit Na+/H+ antiporter MnhD subunit